MGDITRAGGKGRAESQLSKMPWLSFSDLVFVDPKARQFNDDQQEVNRIMAITPAVLLGLRKRPEGRPSLGIRSSG